MHLAWDRYGLECIPREERMQKVSELLDIPGHILPVALISIGYPDELKETPGTV